jgi:hypothetical protein
MSGFNQDSAMPEVPAGGDESAIVTQERTDAAQPSAVSTDRYGLVANGKQFLLRSFNIMESAAGRPYFTPIDSLLKTFVQDASEALAEARARVRGDEDLQERVAALSKACGPYFEAMLEDAGEDRAWLARSLVIWPLTDKVGFQLYKATSGEADLLDYGSYLARTDANIQNAEDLENHEGFQKRTFWTDMAYDELGVVDGIIAAVDPDSIDYNIEAIVRAGYQSAAQQATRQHLQGVTAATPITSDTATDDIKSNILASRRAASAA